MKFWSLVFWMLATMILTFTVVGMLIFPSMSYNDRTSWMEMGYDLSNIKSDKTCNGILYFLWIIFSLVLVISIVGLFLFICPEGFPRSTWLQIGTNLKNSIIKE